MLYICSDIIMILHFHGCAFTLQYVKWSITLSLQHMHGPAPSIVHVAPDGEGLPTPWVYGVHSRPSAAQDIGLLAVKGDGVQVGTADCRGASIWIDDGLKSCQAILWTYKCTEKYSLITVANYTPQHQLFCILIHVVWTCASDSHYYNTHTILLATHEYICVSLYRAGTMWCMAVMESKWIRPDGYWMQGHLCAVPMFYKNLFIP